ncbi:MAG TPA: UDP-N-acetylmuramoyl-L-alanyl-D-glutamate--2,6-diaminopimelate ligase, partial [Polyangia bacterium]
DTRAPAVAGLRAAGRLQERGGVRLAELLRGVDVVGVDGGGAGALDLEIGEVRDDSRAVAHGDLFVATRGQTVDGHDFLGAAAARGAVAAVVDADAAQGFPGVRVRVPSSTRALAIIAANRWGRPADAMTMVAVTGTNGKTTTTFLVEGLVRAAGGVPGVLGTVEYRYGTVRYQAPFTTPTPLVLHATLAEMRAAGVTHVALEASSHALELGRLDGVRFAVAAFTNLTQDHLDFHGTMQAYAESKAKLFREHLADGGVGVVNMDNEWGAFMLQEVRGRALAVATSGVPEILVMSSAQTLDGIDAEFMTPIGAVRVRSPLIGAFNLENLGIGVGIGVGLGLDAATIARGLGSVRGVPGRLERVDNDRGFGVFVDYAHTPDALERVMAALRPLARGRLIVVFGCGGDRDKSKRPKMGRAVARDAELPIVTSDNPRTEDPRAIIDMILDGVREVRADGFLVEVERRKAIAAAVDAARPGDIVLIAGKGHEDYQIVGKEKHHFDDRQEARAALAKVANRPANGQS